MNARALFESWSAWLGYLYRNDQVAGAAKGAPIGVGRSVPRPLLSARPIQSVLPRSLALAAITNSWQQRSSREWLRTVTISPRGGSSNNAVMMSNSQTLLRRSEAARSLLTLASVLILLAVLGVVLFASLRSPLKDDIAWLLYVARRWMAGRELYVDVVEVNPPLIIWLSAIPIQLANWLRVDGQLTAVPCFIALLLGCSWWTAGLLRGTTWLHAERLAAFAAIGTVLLAVPGAELGQREHLLAASMLPYLVLLARELDGVPNRLAHTLLAGAVAGLGCALKPRYGAVFVVLEALALMRGLRPWRVLPLSALGAVGAYAAAVAVFCPAYLARAVPMALALYGSSDVPFWHLVADCSGLLFGEAVAVVLLLVTWRRMPERRLMLVLVCFVVTSMAVCLIDGKDWFYHRLPATIGTILALLLWTASVLMHRTIRWRWLLPPLLLAGYSVTIFAVNVVQRLEPQVELALTPERGTVAHLEQLIREQHAHTYIAFSEWIALGFPVVNETGVSWASRFDSMWALKGEMWRARFDPRTKVDWPVQRWVVHDFIVGCPDLAVVDVRGVNYVDVLREASPTFARAWAHYRPIAAFDGLVVYRRSAAGCVNPWVAAAGPGKRAAN